MMPMKKYYFLAFALQGLLQAATIEDKMSNVFPMASQYISAPTNSYSSNANSDQINPGFDGSRWNRNKPLFTDANPSGIGAPNANAFSRSSTDTSRSFSGGTNDPFSGSFPGSSSGTNDPFSTSSSNATPSKVKDGWFPVLQLPSQSPDRLPTSNVNTDLTGSTNITSSRANSAGANAYEAALERFKASSQGAAGVKGFLNALCGVNGTVFANATARSTEAYLADLTMLQLAYPLLSNPSHNPLKILHVGIDSGFLTAALALISRAEDKILALDESTEALQKARENFGKDGKSYYLSSSRVILKQGDIVSFTQGPLIPVHMIVLSRALTSSVPTQLQQLLVPGGVIIYPFTDQNGGSHKIMMDRKMDNSTIANQKSIQF